MLSIQIKSLNNEVLSDEVSEIERSCNKALDRLDRSIREVIVTLHDSNGPRGGIDKQCCIHLSFTTGSRVVVKAKGVSFVHAANLACAKIRQVAVKHLDKRRIPVLKKPQSDLEWGLPEV